MNGTMEQYYQNLDAVVEDAKDFREMASLLGMSKNERGPDNKFDLQNPCRKQATEVFKILRANLLKHPDE